MLKYLIALVLFAIVGALIFIRLSPSDIAKYHVQSDASEVGNFNEPGGFAAVRQFTASQVDMRGAVNRIILKTPRTKRVAGNLGTAFITYETRSAVFGFPDYTTVSFVQAGERGNDTALMVIESRLRFWVYDMDTNKARVLGWLEALGPLTVDP